VGELRIKRIKEGWRRYGEMGICKVKIKGKR
jgi:hypothetical protein